MEVVTAAREDKWKLATHYIERTRQTYALNSMDTDRITSIRMCLENGEKSKTLDIEGSEQLYLLLNDCVGSPFTERKVRKAVPEVLFMDSATRGFLSKYLPEKPFMLKSGQIHTIIDAKRMQYVASDGTVYAVLSALMLYGNKEKKTLLHVLLPATHGSMPYIDRTENFILGREGLGSMNLDMAIKPKADICRIIVNPKNKLLDLDKLFMALSTGEPMMKAGEVYLLNGAVNIGSNVRVTYSKVESASDEPFRPIMSDEDFILFNIAGYPSDSPFAGRRADEIARFFEDKTGQYFTVGENIYDNMLDYMYVGTGGMYPVLKFGRARPGDIRDAAMKIKTLKAAVRRDPLNETDELGPNSSKWTENEERSFSGTSIKSIPQLCP